MFLFELYIRFVRRAKWVGCIGEEGLAQLEI